MQGLIPESLPMNIGLFLLGTAGVWLTASKLTNYVDVISDRTGLGKAFAGILFLGFATSLPEIATTGTAAHSGSAELAVTNLMGGVSMQIVVLVLVDMFAVRNKAITSHSPKAALIMQGVILSLILAIAMAAMMAKELYSFKNIGLWTAIIFSTYLLGLFTVYRFEGDPRWKPVSDTDQDEDEDDQGKEKVKKQCQEKFKDVSTGNVVLRFLLMGAGVLIFGFLVTKSAEKLVEQSGLKTGVVGATLLALATSMPEITTTWSAVKLGAYSMAIGSILGTNTLEVALLFFADIFYREGPILSEATKGGMFLAALGVILTCIYLWGILERRDKTVMGMGIDSLLILLLYVGGIAVFSTM